MSRDIRVLEGGVSRLLTVDKLRTELDGGGSCLWVPEEDTALGTRTIRENGTYYAADDGFYGYSKVTVSGVGVVTGKDSDGSGDDAKASVDPETGEITISKLPSSIRVITPPTNEYGIYQDGQTIDTAGMVVKGYTASGAEWGTVPVSEITLEPAEAAYDAETDTGGGYTDGAGVNAAAFSIVYVQGNMNYYHYDPDTPINIYCASNMTGVDLYLTKYNGYIYGVLSKGSSKYIGFQSPTLLGSSANFTSTGFNGGTIKDSYILGLVPESTVNPYGVKPGALTPTQAGSKQTITAKWARPGDGKELSATFEVLVAPGYGGDEGDGNGSDILPGL